MVRLPQVASASGAQPCLAGRGDRSRRQIRWISASRLAIASTSAQVDRRTNKAQHLKASPTMAVPEQDTPLTRQGTWFSIRAIHRRLQGGLIGDGHTTNNGLQTQCLLPVLCLPTLAQSPSYVPSPGRTRRSPSCDGRRSFRREPTQPPKPNRAGPLPRGRCSRPEGAAAHPGNPPSTASRSRQ